MPLVRISLNASTPDHIRNVADAVHQAMVDTIGIPAEDRFQIITQHGPGELVYSPDFYGIERTEGFIVIQIQLVAGRKVEAKQKLYRRIAELLSERASVRPEDVFISLIGVGMDDFSLGNGRAQLVEDPPARLNSL